MDPDPTDDPDPDPADGDHPAGGDATDPDGAKDDARDPATADGDAADDPDPADGGATDPDGAKDDARDPATEDDSADGDAADDPDPTDPPEGVFAKDSSSEPNPADPPQPTTPEPKRDTVRAPDESDPVVDESSSDDDLIKVGRHALQMAGLADGASYQWRRIAFHTLYLLRRKKGRRKGEFADKAQSLGFSRSEAYKCAHFWGIIDRIDAWAKVKAEESKRRNNGIEIWPSNYALLKEFPSPLAANPKSKEEKDEEKAEEAEARERAKANRNSDDDDEVDQDALRAELARLRRDLEFEKATRQDQERKHAHDLQELERRLARECATSEALAKELEQARLGAPITVVGVVSDPVIDPVATADPYSIPITDKISGDERDAIEKKYDLATAWGGKPGKNDVALRNRRAMFYLHCGERLTPQQAAALKRRPTSPKTLWERDTNAGAILAQLNELMVKADALDAPDTVVAETAPDAPDVVTDPVVAVGAPDAPGAATDQVVDAPDAPDAAPDVPDVAA